MKFLLALILTAFIDPSLKEALDVSVTVLSEDGSNKGSGLLVARPVCGDMVSFALTAAHVVEDSRISETEFTDFRIIQEYADGKAEYKAKVIRYDEKADLALLRVYRPNTFSASARFDDSGLDIGDPVWAVGSYGGTALPHSVSDGVVSGMNRDVVDDVWTQVSAIAQPGSSGSGVFLKSDGRCIGMVIRCKPGVTLIHPISQMRSWAKTAGVEWVFDPAIEVTDESLSVPPPAQEIPPELEQLFKIFIGEPTPAP